MLLQLRPSHAEAWRLLGTILAQHGGVLESDRADQALRRALALEPSWDDLRALRRRVAERRGGEETPPAPAPRPAPSPRAQALFEEAQRLLAGETPEAARAPLAAALTDSPAFVEAAAAFVALAGEAPAPVIQALWGDGEALVHLATEALRASPEAATTELVRPWLDRAAALGVAEALFQRALLRADDADAAGALTDLAAYVGADVNPPHLAEARALRRNLEAPSAARASAVALARELLLADRPRGAVRALGGPCRAGLGGEALVELGRVAEYEGRAADAIACHRLALAADPKAASAGRDALDRIARIAARLPPAQARIAARELARGQELGVATAWWAAARLADADERWDDALALGERFLAAAPADDPMRAEATLAIDRWRRGAGESRAARVLAWRRYGPAGLAVIVLLASIGLVRRRRGRTVAAAVARVPDLFPDVAAAVGELRHDVLKHRTSALSLLGESVTAREEIQRALLTPEPASVTVTAVYDRLRRAAAGAGVALRPLAREPVFGPLARALAQAEALIARPGTGAGLAAVDRELRERHGPALAELLALAPATVLDGARMDALVAAVVPDGAAPAVDLPGETLAVPVPPPALHTIVSNLLRNALQAAGDGREARVVVRVRPGRDAAGRRTVTVLVADSARRTVTLDEIDRRDGQRGLGVVRDLVRRWGGHMVIAPEAAPLVKAIGAAFPAAGAIGGGEP